MFEKKKENHLRIYNSKVRCYIKKERYQKKIFVQYKFKTVNYFKIFGNKLFKNDSLTEYYFFKYQNNSL